jgi:beta-galactosidase
MKPFLLFLIFFGGISMSFAGCTPIDQNSRTRINFGNDWKFALGDINGTQNPAFDDSSWRILDIPHDWSIEGEFSRDNPATPGGGALPGGVGWYRKTFTAGNSGGKLVFIDFDGVYRNSEVWINGDYLGKRPYGYSSFRYDLTPHLKPAGETNVIAVRVDNSAQPNSRWYSGSGIYRNVWLVTVAPVYIPKWGIYITTPEVSDQKAVISVVSKVKNSLNIIQKVRVRVLLVDQAGMKIKSVNSDNKELQGNTNLEVFQKMEVKKPELWSVEKPVLYTVITQVLVNNKVVDIMETQVGIRRCGFDSLKGFFLNGKLLKINGVCNHHDLGCLGAAVNTRALERQLEIMKEMGVNSIRTSHNPPAPELLDLCDRMGFLVMDEAFDMWKKSKTKFDYGLDFDEWHRRDLQDMVLRDRNHPSVFVWSIGNEILEQWDSTGIPLARELASLVKNLDPTRPVTSGMNDPRPHNFLIRSGALDLIGFNYNQAVFTKFPETFPGKNFLGTETVSGLMTRGSYDMPSDLIRRWPVRGNYKGPKPNADYTCSAYDNCSAAWGSTHEETWKLIKKYDFLNGQYIWTGFDYLGEPTPYWWPPRSSYFGIIDLAGFPKDVYYMYQSEWTPKEVLHIFPHWNWNPGDSVDVWAYSSAPEVELFLNGKSLGSKIKQGDDLHLMWRVKWEPGTVKAVSKKEGKEMLTRVIKTTGAPAKIRLIADRTEINSGGNDLSFITVDILDKDDNLVPHADNLVNFELSGGASIAGVDNGNPVSHEPFQASYRKAFNGKCLVVIRSPKVAGNATVTAISEGLEQGEIELKIK